MNCKKIFYCLPLALALIFASCTSTPTDEVTEPQNENVIVTEEVSEEENVEEPVEVPIEEPTPVVEERVTEVEIPADIRFVQALQKLLEQNDIKGAIELFEELPIELHKDVELLYLQASLLYSDSQFNKAIEVCNAILEIDPNHKDTYELLSMLYKRNGEVGKLSALNDKILKVDPYNPSVNIQKADEQVLRKKWKLARTYYGKALHGDPKNIDALFGYAKMNYYLDDLDKAEEYLGYILDIDPTNVNALAYLGTIQFDRENYLKASQFVEIALQLDPTNYNNLIDYGTYLRWLGRYDEAIVSWQKAIEVDSSDFLPYAYIAGVYDQIKNDYEKALSYYYKVIELNPNYYYAYENIGILEFHLGNYEQAAFNFQAAYYYRDTYDYALMTAASLIKSGKEAEAKTLLETEMKKLNRNSTEYALVRFYHDPYNNNAYNDLTRKVNAETNSNIKGKFNYYLGLYNELNGSDKVAELYYTQVASLQAPQFFEYRLAEWGLQK